ncbi:ubiquitin-2 like Rad60 SUMO-like-domain-containing protein [Zychaea mexicana]|uniref:ubiquitin-2 like Rad60 SUMO-like-domain-containing protein n=1 Tax=Zychaea mexicana TaxID=64656 RepID=UPI0022FE38B0|nr:ubiquitin-2 like Rad60 SUMO-like-domain-containing protein [Zychaea mexicana]KAI9489695.1 ubiquitin-2 like Rad60 SUMO-like-domain-containing protein [Zychaea mexicana]
MADFDICNVYAHRRPAKRKTTGKKKSGQKTEKIEKTEKAEKIEKRKSQYEEFLQTRAKLGVDGSRTDSDDSDSDDHKSSSKKKQKLLYSELNKRLHSQQSRDDEEDDEDRNDGDSLGLDNENVEPITDDMSFEVDTCDNRVQSSCIELSDDDGADDGSGDLSASFESLSSLSPTMPRFDHIQVLQEQIRRQEKPRARPPPPVIPTLEEMADLDPDLVKLAAASSTPDSADAGSSSAADESLKAEKVCIKVEFVNLKELTGEAMLKAIERLCQPIKVILLESDPFEKLLQYFCKTKFLKQSEIILVYNGIPVMLRATPSSLKMIPGIKSKNLMKAYLKDDYEKYEQERTEQLKRKLQQTPFDENFIESLEQTTEVAKDDPAMHIKIRGKNNEDTNMRVKQTTLLRTIVQRYAELKGLESNAVGRVRLSFDGEDLSLDDTIGDTELEDEDVVEVVIS